MKTITDMENEDNTCCLLCAGADKDQGGWCGMACPDDKTKTCRCHDSRVECLETCDKFALKVMPGSSAPSHVCEAVSAVMCHNGPGCPHLKRCVGTSYQDADTPAEDVNALHVQMCACMGGLDRRLQAFYPSMLIKDDPGCAEYLRTTERDCFDVADMAAEILCDKCRHKKECHDPSTNDDQLRVCAQNVRKRLAGLYPERPMENAKKE